MTLPNPAHIELAFRPNIELISVARRFVSDVYGRLLGDPDVTSRLALATHELLENAVKYSLDGTTTIRIGIFQADDGKRTVSVRTRNRASPENLSSLRALIDEIAAAADSFVFYQTLMRRNAKRADGSGLGLARICAEGEMTMRYEIEGEELTVIAQAELAAGASQ